MKRMFGLIILALLLSSCSIAPPTVETYFQTATPVPTLTAFESTQNFASDQFLFVEVSAGDMCSDECHCAVSEPIVPPFEFINGKLYILRVFLDTEESWSQIRANHAPVGLYNYQTMEEAHFDFITAFPYPSPDSDFLINGVNVQGELSVRTNYGDVLVKPGDEVNQEWVEFTDNPACQILHSVGITNFGFFEDDQIVILEEDELYPFP